MVVTFIDKITGRTGKSKYPFGIWWWAEGNGSCDCNRSSCFEGLHEELEDKHGEGVCFGLERCFAIDVEDHLDQSVEQALVAFNNDVYEPYKLKTKEDIIRVINEGFY